MDNDLENLKKKVLWAYPDAIEEDSSAFYVIWENANKEHQLAIEHSEQLTWCFSASRFDVVNSKKYYLLIDSGTYERSMEIYGPVRKKDILALEIIGKIEYLENSYLSAWLENADPCPNYDPYEKINSRINDLEIEINVYEKWADDDYFKAKILDCHREIKNLQDLLELVDASKLWMKP